MNTIPRRRTYKAFAPAAASAAAAFFLDDTAEEQPRHFLDACALCHKALRPNRDIYMYRGDTPFCSEECRQERIEMDEAAENSCKLSTATKKNKSVANNNSKAQTLHARTRTGTVAVV